MKVQSAERRRLLLMLAVPALVLPLLFLPPLDWTAVTANLAALPWGGPLWWLLRAAFTVIFNSF